MRLIPGQFAVVLDPGTDEQEVFATYAKHKLALEDVLDIRACGDKADVMKVDADGNLTTEF